MLIGRRICFCGCGEVRLSLDQRRVFSLGAFGLFQGRVHSILVPLKVQLLVFPLLDSLLHRMEAVFGTLSRLDQPLFHFGQVVRQISLQLLILVLDAVGSADNMVWCLSRDVALVIVAGPHDWGIKGCKLVEDTVLMGQDGNPRLSPCFGGLDDLGTVRRLPLHQRAKCRHTLVNNRSASSKSFKRTEICCSSALLLMYLPKCRWTLCIVTTAQGQVRHSDRVRLGREVQDVDRVGGGRGIPSSEPVDSRRSVAQGQA